MWKLRVRLQERRRTPEWLHFCTSSRSSNACRRVGRSCAETTAYEAGHHGAAKPVRTRPGSALIGASAIVGVGIAVVLIAALAASKGADS